MPAFTPKVLLILGIFMMTVSLVPYFPNLNMAILSLTIRGVCLRLGNLGGFLILFLSFLGLAMELKYYLVLLMSTASYLGFLYNFLESIPAALGCGLFLPI